MSGASNPRTGPRKRGLDRPRATSLYYFDRKAADLACDFFPTFLVHTKGEWAGQPFELEEWQKREFIRPLFGWKRREDGFRRYRLAYVELPKKTGKSQMGAGLGLLLLTSDNEPGAEVYSAARDKPQAGVVFGVARNMVRASASLSARVRVFQHHLFVPDSLSVYRALSADAENKEGLNPHVIIFDELHVQDDRLLWDTLTSARGARRQPLIIAITTAGTDKKTLCGELHDRAVAVRDGIEQDETLLPVVYGIKEPKEGEEEEDWEDREVWKRCNPNLGVTVRMSYLEEEYQKAKRSPAYQNTFIRYFLNGWVAQVIRWIVMKQWDACAGDLDFKQLEEALAGQRCIAGLDCSSNRDLTSLVLTFKRRIMPGHPAYPTEKEMDDTPIPGFEYGDPFRVYDVLPYFFCPEDAVEERSKTDRVRYDLWARDGFLLPTPGNAIDHDFIRKTINDLGKIFCIDEIAGDPYNAHQLLMQLEGQDGFIVSRVRQGFLSLSAPTKALDSLYLRGGIRHGGHPLLRWCANNAALEQDAADNWKPSKKKSSERIDGIAALVTALARQIVLPDEEENRELQALG